MSRIKILTLITAGLYLTACAQQPTKSLQPERVHFGSWEQDIGYAQLLKQGDRIYVSGLVSEAKTFDEQVTEIYTTIAKILTDNQLDSSHILKETIYTTDINALQNAIPLRKRFYPNNIYPSASWVQVQRLYTPKNQVEVELEIWRPLAKH